MVKPMKAVKFLARGDGYTTFLQPDSATLLLSRLTPRRGRCHRIDAER